MPSTRIGPSIRSVAMIAAILPTGGLVAQAPPPTRSFLPDAPSFVERFFSGEDRKHTLPGVAMCPDEHPWNEEVFRGILEGPLTPRLTGRAFIGWAAHTGRCADSRLDTFVASYLDAARESGEPDRVFSAVTALGIYPGVDLSPPVEAALRRIVFDPSLDGRPSLFEHVAEARSTAAGILFEQVGEAGRLPLIESFYESGAPPYRIWNGLLHSMGAGRLDERIFLLNLVTGRPFSGGEGRATASVISALATGLRTNPPPAGSGFPERFDRVVGQLADSEAAPRAVQAAAREAMRGRVEGR